MSNRGYNCAIFWSAILLAGAMSAANSATAASINKKDLQSETIGDILQHIEKKSEKVTFQKRQSALPKFEKEKAAPPPVDLRQVKPPSSKKLYYDEGTDEAELEQTTDESINQLYKLSIEFRRSPRRGELWLRLAEQYVDKARLIEYRLMSEHDKALGAYEAGKAKRPPPVNLAAAKEYNKKAVQLYEWFVRDFPKDPKMDQALFFLGFNYFELGDPKKGEAYYIRLTKEYPNSEYVSESNFALGEYYFDNNKFKPALQYYSRVAANRANRLYSFAMYKIAWCYYKLNRSRDGLKYLEQVILEGRRSKGRHDKSMGGVSRIRLATEAIKDLIVFFAEAGDVRMARPYFTSVIGPHSANANLAKLAYFYIDTGNRDSARYVFKDLISQNPNAIKSYDYEYAIVKAYAAGNPKVFSHELYFWIQNYGPGSSWQRANSNNRGAVQKANQLMEALLRNHVLLQHQIAQTSRTKSAYAAARASYELYFHTFQSGPNIDEMHFFFGELLFDLADYAKAAIHYSWVVANAPKSKYFSKALLNSMLAYEKLLPSDQKIRKIVGTTTQPVPFAPAITDFEGAAKQYLAHSPQSSNVVAVKYRLGSLYYLFNHFDQAIPYLTDIIQHYPTTPYAKYSANHLLDIYNLEKNYAGLETAANQILNIPALAKSDVGSEIRDIKLRTEFKLAKDLEDKKDYLNAAKSYQAFSQRNPTSSLAVPALFNAAVNFERAGQVAVAMGIYSSLASSRGHIPADIRRKSSEFVPVLYEKSGEYLKAARAYEAYANLNPKSGLALAYRYNAAVIYDGLNAYGPAIKNYQFYFNKKHSRDRIEVLFLIGKVYERIGQTDKAIAIYKKYLSMGPSNAAGVVEATFTIAKLEGSHGRKGLALTWLKKTVAVQRRLSRPSKPIGVSFAAEAKYKLIHPTFEELVSIHIPKSPRAQAIAVKKKLAVLAELRRELKIVINYNDGPQIVASLTLLGQALENMYNAFVNAPVPAGLKPDEIKQYKALLQQKADPFKAEAIQTYQTAIRRGDELQAYTPTLVIALKNLSLLKGEAHQFLGTNVMLTKLPDTMGL